MKQTRAVLCVAVLVTLVALLAGVASADGFAGTWTVHGVLGNPPVAQATPVCVFRQAGDRISGTCRGPNGIGAADGVASGNTIIWHWHIIATTSVGMPGVATFSGTLDPDGYIRGTWRHSSMPKVSGPFVAEPVK